MGLFDFFSTGLLLSAVDRISNKITQTESFKILSSEDTNILGEYRDFERIMVSSCLAFIALDLNIKNKKHKKDIQTVYIGKNSNFFRKIISGKIKTYNISVDFEKAKNLFKGDAEALICWEAHIVFEKYLEEIKKALALNSAEYFLKYNNPIFNEFTGELTEGEYRYFDFLLNLLVPEEQISYDYREGDIEIIGTKSVFDFNESTEELLSGFINDLVLILKD